MFGRPALLSGCQGRFVFLLVLQCCVTCGILVPQTGVEPGLCSEVKNLPVMRSLGREDILEKEMATHPSILA